jgi:hypothetical protein
MEFVASDVVERSAVKDSYGEQEKANEARENGESHAKYVSGGASVAGKGLQEQDDGDQCRCRCAGVSEN